MEYAIIVIDIGMTNKKVAVYDDSLHVLDSCSRFFEPVYVDGVEKRIEAHDLDAMENWFLEQIKKYAKEFPVKAIAVSTHGATFVCIGKDGKAAVPCVYYTHEPGEDFDRRFYDFFGKKEDLQARTGTPAFKALINPAKGILFSQEQFGTAFKEVKAVLPYPQYWGFRLTGKTGVESTYMGNHTYLWDHIDNSLSSVARKLGIDSLLPGKLCKSWDVMGKISAQTERMTGLDADVIVTMGIHDSNSSLLPHFAKKGEKGFILNSTGTWCVIMNPVEKYGFSPDELGKAVFFNISAFGTPIKTAIFIGGLEFDIWSKKFCELSGRTDIPGWDEELYRIILSEKTLFLLPELTPGSGQFPSSKARVVLNAKDFYFEDFNSLPLPFAGFKELVAALRISLVMQTVTALERAGLEKGTEVFVEGGFQKDESYNRLLSSAFPENKLFLTDIAEATSLGAAITAKMAVSGKSLNDLREDFEVSYIEQEKGFFPELEEYRRAWIELARINC